METLYSERTSFSVHMMTLSLVDDGGVVGGGRHQGKEMQRASSLSSKTPFQFLGKLIMQNTFDSRYKEEFMRVELVHEGNRESVNLILHKYRFAVDRSHYFDFDGEATVFLLKPNENTREECTTPPRKMTMSSSRNSGDPNRASTSIFHNCFPVKSVLAALRESFSYPGQGKEAISGGYGAGAIAPVRIELKLLFQLQYKYTLFEANDGGLYKPPPSPQISRLSTLAASFKKLLDHAVHADVQLEVDSTVFPAHIAILSSQSEVFKVMFESNMMEKKTKRVVIRDMSPTAVQEMLNFLYTRESGSFDDNIDLAIEMLHAAEKYIIPDLRAASEEALEKQDLSKLAVDDILGLYMCSRQLNMPQVQINALNGLKAKGPFLGASKAFEKFCCDHPEIVPEFFTQFASV